ncbi:hypothetical protein [Peptostreptococcus faecalis]|uniref:hypothetical protein n=1 Tax=Peptostreptococcus faecalis TaxID=2045015 RepID=UPI000C79F85B|nr:hypothetical protein [Peptostreptococcus faecalis]
MRTIKLSELPKKEKYRDIISVTMDDGEIDYIYVLNPTGEIEKELLEVCSEVIFEKCELDDSELMKLFIEKLTNIEVEYGFQEVPESDALARVYTTLKTIYFEMIDFCYRFYICEESAMKAEESREKLLKEISAKEEKEDKEIINAIKEDK